MLAKRNLIRVPIWKHCQTGDGMGAPPKDQRGEAGVSYVPTAGGGGRILKTKKENHMTAFSISMSFYTSSVGNLRHLSNMRKAENQSISS